MKPFNLSQHLSHAAVYSLATITELRLNEDELDAAVNVRGYHAVADGGGGVFVFDPADTTSADNSGTIIVDAIGQRWKRQLGADGALSRKMFGAWCDLAHDDTAAIQKMFDAANNPAGNLIVIEPGQSIVSATITINQPIRMVGPGPQILDVGTPYAEFVVTNATMTLFDIRHSRANAFQNFSIRSGVAARTAGADFHIIGDGTTQPVGNVWDNITVNGSCNVIVMDGGKHWKVTNCLFQYGYNDTGTAIYWPNTAFPDAGDNAITNTQFVSATSGSGRGYAAFYMESAVGTMITGCKFFGALIGIHILYKAVSGNLQIAANSFEQQTNNHIFVQQNSAEKGGGNVTITGNEFSNLDAVAGGGVVPTNPGIHFAQGAALYLNNIAIVGNVFNSKYAGAWSEILVNDGAAVVIADNTFNFYGYTNFGAIQTGGNASAVIVANNAFTGMNSNQHYLNSLNGNTKVLGDTLKAAELSTWANGSMVYVSDGVPGSPINGSGPGCMGMRIAGAWKGI